MLFYKAYIHISQILKRIGLIVLMNVPDLHTGIKLALVDLFQILHHFVNQQLAIVFIILPLMIQCLKLPDDVDLYDEQPLR